MGHLTLNLGQSGKILEELKNWQGWPDLNGCGRKYCGCVTICEYLCAPGPILHLCVCLDVIRWVCACGYVLFLSLSMGAAEEKPEGMCAIGLQWQRPGNAVG